MSTKNLIGGSKEEAYESAVAWCKESIDKDATVEPL